MINIINNNRLPNRYYELLKFPCMDSRLEAAKVAYYNNDYIVLLNMAAVFEQAQYYSKRLYIFISFLTLIILSVKLSFE